VHTDEGLVGLGETFWGAQTVEAYVHESVAPRFWGATLWRSIVLPRISWGIWIRSTGAETRGNSAIDIALWDLYGKLVGQPIAQLLGGFSREKIRTYNTCAALSTSARPTMPG